MKLFCLHTHTNFCDGQDDIDSICKSAYEKGLSSLGFSSHAPLPKESGLESDWHMKNDELNAYIEAVLMAKKAWAGQLTIYLGLEIDYIQGIMGPNDARFKQLDLDYCIGSVHYVIPPHGTNIFTVDGPMEETVQGIKEGFKDDANAYMYAYWEAVQHMIDDGGFDILGHIDLVKKNNQNEEFFSLNSNEYLHAAEKTLDTLIGTSIVAEVNTGGIIRGKTKDCYPSLQILNMMKARHLPVTISADAHRASDLVGHYGTALQSLRDAGYNAVQYFEGKPGGKAQWSAIPLDASTSSASDLFSD
jgi:histidinol-phosphatase (PHP family)